MNIGPAHWHLLLNHFPIILSIVGTCFLAVSFLIKKQHLKFGALLILIFGAAMSFPAYKTGNSAEHSIEKIAGVSESAIENHEHIATTGYRIIIITGFIALITLLLVHTKKKAATIFLIITLLAAATSAGYMSYVGYTGGEIRHSEIRGDFGDGNPIEQPNGDTAEPNDQD